MKKILFLFLLLFGLSGYAAQIITATVSVTNSAGTTNGQTITINGNVRTWTNSVVVPAAQILTNNTPEGSATNLFLQIASYPINGLTLSRTTSTNVVLKTSPGFILTVSVSAGWGEVSYSTNETTSATVVRVPVSVEANASRTNVTSGVVAAINDQSNTNAIQQMSKAAEQLLGTTNTQTITGDKTFTGIVIITNLAGQIFVGTASATNFHGIVGNFTNGVYWSAILTSPTLTNGANYGDAFRSPGSGNASEQIGFSASASGDSSVAFGQDASATGTSTVAIGNSASAIGLSSSAIGYGALASADDSTAIGNATIAVGASSLAIGAGADAEHANSSAIGAGSLTTATNQIRLGNASHWVSIPGSLHVEGVQTNGQFVGTNNFRGDIAFNRYALTSLANGNNAAIPVGTNVFVEVSGPSSAFTVNGINGSPNRDGKLLILLNLTGQNMTIAHDSGTDPTAANRIYTMTGSDHATTANGAAMLIYSGSSSRWILLSLNQ